MPFDAKDIESQTVQILGDTFFIEDTDNRIFSKDTRHDGDAEVNRLTRHAHFKATVLRDTPLRDIEFTHDLDT